jgi:aspartokinase
MSDLEARIENLEECIDDLQIDLHASKVAITILSTVINGMSQEPGLLAQAFEEGRKAAPPVEFTHPVPDGYEEKLNDRIIALLSKAE